jgi:voltage-gated potassium channel
VVAVVEDGVMETQNTATRYRARLYELLEHPSPQNRKDQLVTKFLLVLILANVAVAIIQSVPGLADRFWRELAIFEAFSLMVFSVEYIARLWSSGSNPKYAGVSGTLRFALRPGMLIDAVATFPSIIFPALDLRALRILRVFRLLRGLKLVRYSKSLQITLAVFRERRDQLLLCLGLVAGLVVFSASIMYYVEHDAQPEHFSSIPASMWWAVCTLTTVGYGDVVPQTPVGRLLASVMSVLGLGLFALPAGILASGFSDRMSENHAARICKHCGEPLE